MTIYADYSAALLTGDALKAAGFGGAIRYAGTPGHTKNTTPAEVASLVAAGLDVHGVFELGTSDFTGGYNAGVTNAKALLSDANHCGIPGALFMSADEHLSASQIPTWQSYLRGAATILGPRLGAYGFSEAIAAAQSVGVPYLWQCGSRSALLPGVNLYQRNTDTATVSGIQVDINDVINPITGGETVATLDDTFQPVDAQGNPVGNAVSYGYALQQVYEAIFYGGASTGNQSLVDKADNAVAAAQAAEAAAKAINAPAPTVAPTKLTGSVTVPIEVDLAGS